MSTTTRCRVEKGVRKLFSLCADACGESDEIVSAEKVPEPIPNRGCCSCSNLFDGNRGGEDRTSWRPEVPFMAGSSEGLVRQTSQTTHTNDYV